jgi:hypothetical protein
MEEGNNHNSSRYDSGLDSERDICIHWSRPIAKKKVSSRTIWEY